MKQRTAGILLALLWRQHAAAVLTRWMPIPVDRLVLTDVRAGLRARLMPAGQKRRPCNEAGRKARADRAP